MRLIQYSTVLGYLDFGQIGLWSLAALGTNKY